MTDLTRQVRPWLFHIARSYRLPHELADDVVQSTMLAALLHIHRLRDPGSGLSWLSVVARREALRVINLERRYICVDDVDSLHAVPDSSAGPEEIVLDEVDRAAIRRTIAKLPNRHRVVLEQLIHADQPSYAAISAALKVPVGSIGPTRRRASSACVSCWPPTRSGTGRSPPDGRIVHDDSVRCRRAYQPTGS